MLIVEVKGDNKIDDPIVQAKEKEASEIASTSGMVYKIIGDSNKWSFNFRTK
jgi:type III restriction enzyme